MHMFRVVSIGLLASTLAASHQPQLSAAELAGTVTTPEGKPISGAVLDISTAAVKKGTSPLCPSCYLDCAKTAETNAEGEFAFTDLDDTLRFSILVAAPGYQPKLVKKVDPAKGAMSVSLEPKTPNPPIVFRGRVLDAKGQAIAGALVSTYGWNLNGRRTIGSSFPGDKLAVTDADGVFELNSQKEGLSSAIVKINAANHAQRLSPSLKANADASNITMEEGVTLHGRLMHAGKPVPNANVGIAQINRAVNEKRAFEPRVIGTDDQGHFVFTNVQPNDAYYLYGCRDSLPEGTVTALQTVLAGATGSEVEADALEVISGVPITGTLKLTDGKPIPKGVRLLVSQEKAWDSQLLPLGPDGRFRFHALPEEEISFYARIRNYVYDQPNSEYYRSGPTITVAKDQGDIEIPFRHKSQPPSEGSGLALHILTPDGQPAEGAVAAIVAPGAVVKANSDLYLNVTTAEGKRQTGSVADAAGRLRTSEPARKEDWEVIALHPSGFLRLPYDPTQTELRLQPWGKLTGTAKQGTVPLAQGEVLLRYYEEQTPETISLQYLTGGQIDPEGRFTVDRVIDGVGQVSMQTNLAESSTRTTHLETFVGKTTQANLGGTGSTVRGQVEIPAELPAQTDLSNAHFHVVSSIVENYPARPQVNGLPPQERKKKWRAYHEAVQQAKLKLVTFTPILQADGSFVLQDVPPGDYRLSLSLRPSGGGLRSGLQPLASGHTRFTVAEDNQEIELPPLTVKVQAIEPALQVGDKAPAFTLHTLSGKKVESSSLRGRPTVIYFFHGIDQSDEQQLKGLQKLLNSLPERDRPAALAVILQGEIPASLEDQLTLWSLGKLDILQNRAMSQAFRVRRWPLYFILDSTGRITAKGHQAERILADLAAVKTAAN